MKPSIGRIVIFRFAGADVPAIVCIVNDSGSLGLWCFHPETMIFQGDVKEGTAIGEWSWPARVSA